MHLVNLIKNKKTFWYLIFSLFFLITRIPGLNFDTINPDGVNWHGRSEQFVVGLKMGQLERTYQHYQPGVTLMWLVGPTVEILKQLNGDLIYDQETFLLFDLYAKIAIVIAQLGISILGIYLLSRIIGFEKSILTFSIFSLEPFFLANSRLLHLDVLLSLLLFLGLICSYLAITEKNNRWAIASGIFFGLSILTKSVGIGGMLFAAGIGGLYVFKQSGIKEAVRYSITLLLISMVTFVVLFPAMWVDAWNVILYMYDGIERVGVRKGHNQIVLGNATRDGGIIFYPLVFLVKSSPFLLAGILLFLAKLKKIPGDLKRLVLYMGIFFLGYFIVMTISTKKIDRYFIPVYPYFGMLVALLFDEIKKAWKNVIVRVSVLMLFIFSMIYPIFSLYPYYFTYTNPLLGSPMFVHKNIIAQKPFGVGIVELKNLIIEKYGTSEELPSLGFYDKKPMAAIYKGSRIFDVELDGTKRYDVLVLGVNEEIPTKVLESEFKFNLDYIVKINGLDYWYLYVKEN